MVTAVFKPQHCTQTPSGAPCRKAGSSLRLLLCAVLLMTAVSCAGGSVRKDTPPPGWASSVEALAGSVAGAVARNDRQALERLCVSREEYAAHVWPALHIGKVKEWQAQQGFVWKQHHMRSDSGLSLVLDRFGGRPCTVLKTVFKEKATEYEGIRVHGGAAVRLRDAGGAERESRLFGSVIEKNGYYKVFSYNIH